MKIYIKANDDSSAGFELKRRAEALNAAVLSNTSRAYEERLFDEADDLMSELYDLGYTSIISKQQMSEQIVDIYWGTDRQPIDVRRGTYGKVLKKLKPTDIMILKPFRIYKKFERNSFPFYGFDINVYRSNSEIYWKDDNRHMYSLEPMEGFTLGRRGDN